MKHMDACFDESNMATVELVGTVLDQIDGFSAKFNGLDVKFDRIEGQVNRIEGELRITNRMVRKHSLDIMELRPAA